MGFWDGAGSGLLNLPFQLLQNSQNNANAAEHHDWAKEDASIDRAWQREMSSSAHQREVEDLRKAGLNPILSAGGAGAPAGSGAMASSEVPEAPDYGKTISSALEAKMNEAQRNLMKEQESQAASSAELNKAQAEQAKANKEYLESLKGKTIKETQIMEPESWLGKQFQKFISTPMEKHLQLKPEAPKIERKP